MKGQSFAREKSASGIRAIAVDIDGTLLTSRGNISPRTLQALHHCAATGITVYVATARPRRLVFRDSEVQGDADFLKTGGVFYNGAIAFDKALGEYAHWPIAGDTVSEVVKLIEAHDKNIQIALQFEENSHSFRLPMDDPALLGWGFARQELLPFEEARIMDCSKIVALGERSAVGTLHEKVIASFGNSLTVFRSDTGGWIQVMSLEARKELALMHLLRSRNISFDDAIVFGDDLPDVGMFKTFKHSVAMGNASDAVKAVATYVTASNDEDGIERALHDQFGLI